jgi:hypothetical protein
MSAFTDFLDEVIVADPDRDHEPLAGLLHAVEYNADEIALSLFEPVRWTISQRKYPVGARLAMLDRLVTRAIGPMQ